MAGDLADLQVRLFVKQIHGNILACVMKKEETYRNGKGHIFHD